MAINIKELRATPVAERSSRSGEPSLSNKDLVRLWTQRQQEHRTTMFAKFGGKFRSQEELLAYLSDELSKGERSRAAIALSAGISTTTLSNYLKKGKLQPSQAASEAFDGSPLAQADS